VLGDTLHKLKYMEYEENGCSAIIQGGKPYFLLNIEEYHEIYKQQYGQFPHCDFLYVDIETNENNKKQFVIYIVELKEINTNENLDEILEKSRKKLIGTCNNVIPNITNALGINNKIIIYFIIVLPDKIAHVISAMLKRYKLNSIRYVKDAWVTPSWSDIRQCKIK
jgi:hypothetical protein